MTERSLWRLDGATAATLVQPVRLEQGLRLHIAHTELTMVLMQIGDQQQAYIGVGGCDGCTHGRCVPGCYVELLKRLLQVCFDACTLRAVAGGGHLVLEVPERESPPVSPQRAPSTDSWYSSQPSGSADALEYRIVMKDLPPRANTQSKPRMASAMSSARVGRLPRHR